MNCETIQTDVEIFYQGDKASEEEEADMFALLMATIESQAEAGHFAEVGSIGSVASAEEVTVGSSGTFTSADDTSTESTFNIVGPAIAVIAALAIGGAVWYKLGKSNDSEDSEESGNGKGDETGGETDDDERVPEAQVLVVEETDDGRGKKKMKKNEQEDH